MPLDYADIAVPGPGEVVAVAPGVLWARISMPCPPGAVNCWLLRLEDGWALVDTGPDTPEARAEWEGVFAAALEGLPVRKVICTHHHFDHVGLAAAFCARWRAPLLMTRIEWLMGRLLPLQWAGEKPQALTRLERATGLPEASARQFWETRVLRCIGQSQRLPDSFTELRPGSGIETRGGLFRVHVANGHSPAPVLLHDAARGVLISGDQILPRITPFIGVDYMEPEADPLGPYLDWLGDVAASTEDPLVLPSHGRPFRGMAARAAEVLQHHAASLDHIVSLLDERPGVQDLTLALFGQCDPGDHLAFATQECLAHLRRLVAAGRARLVEEGGIFRCVASREAAGPAPLRRQAH